MSEKIHGATNGMWRHMPAFSHAVGQILQRRRRRPDAMPNEPDQAVAISRATQCRRGGFYQTRFNFHSGGRCVISRSVGVGVSTRRARRAVVSTSTSGAQPNARPAGRESPDHRAHTCNVRHASARIQGAVRCQRRAQHTISARTWWCAEPRRGSCTRGEYRLRRATMSSRVIQRLSGVNTESRRSSNTSGHSALIVESRAARIA